MQRRKKTSQKKIALILFLGLILSVFVVYFWVQIFYPTSFARYPGFEIHIPKGYNLHGIDVSRYQKTINWKAVKEMEAQRIRLKFAFIKATEGEGIVDPQFRRNWLHAEEVNIPRGAYHFFIASRDAEIQAKNFIRIVKLKKGDLPPVLDVEVLNAVSVPQLQAGVLKWLRIVEDHYGVKPIIYSSANFYKYHLGEKFDQYPLWVAHYGPKKRPRIHRQWTFWQHSETGRVNGIKAPVDFNVFYGDSLDLENLKIQ